MKKYKWIVILTNLIIVIGIFNYSVIDKEKTISDGILILLELAPVDPRSLMQGDYMRLEYKISEMRSDEIQFIPTSGYCIVLIDNNGVASIRRYQDSPDPLNNNEHPIKYRKNGRSINIGAESYFFQEGEDMKFNQAKYGGLRVDKKGNSVLTGLYDKNRQKIE